MGGGCLGGVGHVVYGYCNGCGSVCVGGVSRMVGVFWSVLQVMGAGVNGAENALT